MCIRDSPTIKDETLSVIGGVAVETYKSCLLYTSKVVDKWTSGKDSHFINGLEEGKTYILSETVSPEEYVKSTDIEFTVSKEKVNEKVNMKDKQVSFTKTDVTGEKEVEGAEITVTDKVTGKVVDLSLIHI